MEATEQLNYLKYPIRPFENPSSISNEKLTSIINTIEAAPRLYREIAQNLQPEDLIKTYRPGSWNVQQLFHHVADIQLLHLLRMKKALTEPDYKETTLINMDEWVKTPDGITAPIEDSLMMFEGITRRFVFLAKSLDEARLNIQYFHPIRKYYISQAQALAMNAWHVSHHLAHLRIALGLISR